MSVSRPTVRCSERARRLAPRLALAAVLASGVSCRLGEGAEEGAAAIGHLERAAGPTCVRFVDVDAPSSGDGLSWSTALRNVQDGIDAAKAAAGGGSCEVWVAEGTYYLYQKKRKDTVRLRRRVEVYGGFAGHEADRRLRSPTAHETVLDGHEHAGSSNQVYHVVTGEDGAVLDGFVITGGKADGPASKDRNGGGMINFHSAPTVRSCVFRDNSAAENGGAMWNVAADTVVSSCTFQDNAAALDGGAVHSHLGSSRFTRVTFKGNRAGRDGGALYNLSTTAALLSCTLEGNSAGQSGGGA